MKPVVFVEDAADDLENAREFYDDIEEGLGNYCVDSLMADAQRLAIFYGVHAKHSGLHRALSRRFPFGIYYENTDSAVRIVAILDLRRDPSWIRRELGRR